MLAARRWSWLVVLAAGGGLFEALRGELIDTRNPGLVPALILLGACVVPTAFVFFIWSRRLDYGVTGGTIVLVASVGGLIGVIVAGVLEYSTLRRLGVLPLVAVAVIEEAAKLIAPVAVLIFGRHRKLADGLLIGVASGAGFAVLETMGYAFVALIQSGGSIAAVDGVLILRGILSPAAHMAWTGLTAAALWRAADQRWHLQALGRLLGIYLLAVALHTAWDTAVHPVAYLVIALVSLVALAVTAHRLTAPEHHPAALAAQPH